VKQKNKQIVAINICILKSALKTRTIVPNMKIAKHSFFMLSHKIYPNFLERKKESINLLQTLILLRLILAQLEM